MKSSETDILVIAGYEGAGDTHWQQRLVAKLPSAKLVEQDDWLYGSLDAAVARLIEAMRVATKPIVFVGHSAGCTLVALAVPQMRAHGLVERARGAFLVAAPSAAAIGGLAVIDSRFKDIPRQPLPFPSVLVASSDDPFSTLEQSADIARAWGSEFVEAGAQGHINTASGHGPWPEGMMKFAGFLSKLK